MAWALILRAYSSLALYCLSLKPQADLYSDNVKAIYSSIKVDWLSIWFDNLSAALKDFVAPSDQPTTTIRDSQYFDCTHSFDATRLLTSKHSTYTASYGTRAHTIPHQRTSIGDIRTTSYRTGSGYTHHPTSVFNDSCPAFSYRQSHDRSSGIPLNSTSTINLDGLDSSLVWNPEMYKLAFTLLIANTLVFWFICKRERKKYLESAKRALNDNITIEELAPPLPPQVGHFWLSDDHFFYFPEDNSSPPIGTLDLPSTTFLTSELPQDYSAKRRTHRGGRQARARKERYLVKQGLEACTDRLAASGSQKRVRFNLKVRRPRSGKKVRDRKQLAREREGSAYYAYYPLPDDYDF